jgi:hypothetical protein
MQKIFLYSLHIADVQFVSLPRHACTLSVAEQNGQLCLWALLDPEAACVERPIYIHSTGQEVAFPSSKRLIGTVLTGPFVWHIFEEAIV